MEMLPWLGPAAGPAAVRASLLTVATIKVVDYLKSKRRKMKAKLQKQNKKL